MYRLNAWVSVPRWAMVIMLAAIVGACGGNKEPSSTSGEPSAPAGGGEKVDKATAGHVTGTVTLDGMAPKNDAIKMNADPVCIREAKGPQFRFSVSCILR